MFLHKFLVIILCLLLGVSTSPKKGREEYFVKNAFCRMEYVEPFTEEVRNIMQLPKVPHCRAYKDLVISEYDFDLKQYRLHINEKVAHWILGVGGNATLECKFQQIARSLESKFPDETFRILNIRRLQQNFLLPRSTDYIITKCYVRKGAESPKVVQKDGIAFVQERQVDKKVLEEQKDPKPKVIILGLDSMSRTNFRRTMAKSFKYVQGPGWFEMQGFNKMGDNTYPNLVAMLTGHSAESLERICNSNNVGCLDKYPFIWKRFKEEFNYTTAFAEDCTRINTFNYLKPGFKGQPVDYYLRPLMVAMEHSFRLRTALGNTFCVGRHMSFSYVWDFAQQFIKRFILKSNPAWGLFWSNSFTHDVFNAPSILDPLFLDYFKQFERDGLFNQSIVILMADHGMRFNKLRLLSTGYLEERLPMLFIYIPPSFRRKYPHFVNNLRSNRNRLTSMFDLHMTLQHILQLNSSSMADLAHVQANQCKSCQSLFFEIPFNRSCSQAGIPNTWCACNPLKLIKPSPFTQKIGNAVIRKMNDILVEKNLSDICMNFTMKKILSLHAKLPVGLKLTDKMEQFYLIKFITLPNSPVFESTLTWDNKTNELKMDIQQISRLNSYFRDAQCIKDKIAQKYCLCKNAVIEAKLKSKKPIL